MKPLLFLLIFALGLAGGFFGLRLVVPASRVPAPVVPSPSVNPKAPNPALPSPEAASLSISLLPGALTPADPIGGVKKLLAERDPFARTALAYDFAQHLDAAGLAQGLRYLAQLPQGSLPLELEKMLLEKVAESDPAQAATLAASIPNAHAAHELESVVFEPWLKQDPTAAWEWASHLEDRVARNRLLAQALKARAKKDPRAAAAYLLQIAEASGDQPFFKNGVAATATALVKLDRAALTNFLARLPDNAAKSAAIAAVARNLIQSDPRAAVELLATARPNQEIRSAQNSALDAWGKKDLTAALAYADTLKIFQRNKAWETLLPKLAQTDAKAAIELAVSAQSSFLNSNLARRLSESPQITTGDQAFALAAQMPEGALKAEFLRNVAGQLTQKNSTAATQFVERLPDGLVKTMAMSRVVRSWPDSKSNELRDWLTTATPGPARDEAIDQFVDRTVTTQKPGDVLALALTIKDADKQFQVAQAGFSSWRQTDPTAAAAWLASPTVSPSLRQRLEKEEKP